jgi:hypothetical protein
MMAKAFGPTLYRLAWVLTLAGCVAPQQQTDVSVVLPENPQAEQAAENYRSCLREAAGFADEKQLPISRVATLIAPMCYARFFDWEKARGVGLSERERAAFEHGADQRQLDYAENAIRLGRGLASLDKDRFDGKAQ